MKSKLFKRTVASLSALAMVGTTLVVPMTASAADPYYTEDFEAGVTTGWTSQYYADGMSIQTDSNASIGKYFRYLNNTGRGDRTAYYTLPAAAKTVDENKQTVLEFDFNMHNGGGQSDNQLIFLAGGGTPIGNGAYTGDAYALKIDQAMNKTFTVNNTDVSSSGYNDGTWAHVKAVLDFAQKDVLVTVTSLDGSATYYETSKLQMGASASELNYIFAKGARDSSSVGIDNVVVRPVEAGDITGTYYKVTFDVDGTVTTKSVKEGEKVEELPATDKTGYIFKGWNKDDDTTLLTGDDILNAAVTADTAYKAVYEADAAYIEPMVSVDFDKFPSGNILVAGADENTAESNPISVKITGELGTDLMANPDSRVSDLSVSYEFKGFRWVASKNEPTTDDPSTNIYCDSYGEVVTSGYEADFKLKSHPFNYYGQVIATVTYNGETKTVSRALAYIGNPAKASANDILPRGGYVSDFNVYSDDMVGYKLTTSADNKSATDVVADNWAAYGGNLGRGVYLAAEDGKKFLKVKTTGTNSSSFAVNVIDAVTDTQIILNQDVRFYNANSSLILKSVNPVTWTAGMATTFSVNFTGSEININGNKITDAATGVWYNIVISSDVTSGKCFAIVNDANGNKLGESEIVNFSDAGSVTPTYLCYRTPDNSMGELDFNNVRVYRAATDQSSMSTTASAATLAIPDEGDAATTSDLTVSAKTTEGYEAIGAATWTVADEPAGVTVTPSADDSHVAQVSVDSTASAGNVTVNVSIGGITKSIELTVTASKDSIKFASPIVNSISIPMDDTVSETTYSASVIDKDGADIAGKTVALALYDKNNTNPTTVEGVTLENGVLKVTKDAKPCVLTIRATSTNSSNEEITNAIKVTIHGMAFDLGAGTDEDVVSGYTPITATTTYSEKQGYGIEGTATAGGTASIEDADTDNLSGTYVFKLNVPNDKIYKVTLNYSGTAAFENMSTDLSGVVRTNAEKSAVSYLTFVHDGVLDITFSDAVVSSIIIEKVDDKTPVIKPNIYTVGDSTIANNGSWAYVLNRDQSNYPELTALATFTNNGRGGKNLSSYYTGGEFWDRVVTNIKPGDYVMIGDMGTNGMGADFEGSFTYYVDACLALGANVILNSYSPHGAVGAYASGYNSETQTFESYRKDSYDNIVRNIYSARESELAGFVDIGKNADKAFNAYVDDYAANGYESRDAAAQAIIACFGDHNHYSNGSLAAKLMIEGYNGTEGIVSELVRILSNEEPTPTAPAPTPTEAAPTPTAPAPAPTEAAPTPTAPAPTPTEAAPTPTAPAETQASIVFDGDSTVTVTADAETAVLVHAKYKDGRLTKVDTTDVTLTDGTADVTKTDIANGDKLMLWKSVGSQEPLAEAVVVDNVEVNPDIDQEATDRLIWKAQDVTYTAGQDLGNGLSLVFSNDAPPTVAQCEKEGEAGTYEKKIIDGVEFDYYVTSSANGKWSGTELDPAKSNALKYTASADGVLTVYLDKLGADKQICVGQSGMKQDAIRTAAPYGNDSIYAHKFNVKNGETYFIYVDGSKGRYCGVGFNEGAKIEEPEATDAPPREVSETEWTVSKDDIGIKAGTELIKGLTTLFDNTSTNGNYISSGDNGSWSNGAATGTALKYVAEKNGTLTVSVTNLGSAASAKTLCIIEEGGSKDEPYAYVEGAGADATVSAQVTAGTTYYIYGAGTKVRFTAATFTSAD